MATNIFNNKTENCSVTSTDDRINQSNHYIFKDDTITVTCNSGYTWNPYNTRPRLLLNNGTNSKTYYPTLSNDDTVATFTITENWVSNTNINLFGKPSAIASGVPITYNLNNCTISPQPQYYNSAITFVMSLNTGYELTTHPILRYTDVNNEIHSVNFTLSNDVYSLDTTSIHSDLLASISIEIVASATAIIRPLINNLPNTITMNPTVNNVSYGETITFSLNVADSVILNNVFIIIDGVKTTLDSAGDSYSFTFNNINSDSVISIGADVTDKIVINYNLSRCTVEPHNTYYNGENNFYFTFTADVNCIFATPPQIQLTPLNTITATRESDTVYKAYFYLSSYEIENLTSISVVATAILDENAVTNKYGIVSVFKVNKTIMRDVMRKRFYRGTISALENTDLAQFITSLKWCFIDVESTTFSNIVLGFSDTQVQAPLILDDDIELDLGTFTISGIYGTNLDINLVESIKVTLPFINDVILPNIYINKSIHIKYLVNVITGNCKAFIYDVIDDVDILIASYDGNLSLDVPYIFNSGYMQAKNNNNGISTNSNLFNVSPKIIVSEYEKTGDNIFITDKYNQIKNETGYFRVDKVELKSNCLSAEKSMIENLLKSGVYI